MITEAPVKEGEEYNIKIEAVGSKGDGLGKVEGFIIIVPNTKIGEKVRVRVNAVKRKVAFATVVGE